jgi:hypothetical protein
MTTPHSVTHPGKRVVVVLHSGQVLIDRFVGRPKHRRWIELAKAGRVSKAEIKSFAVIKGQFDPKRMGLNQSKRGKASDS